MLHGKYLWRYKTKQLFQYHIRYSTAAGENSSPRYNYQFQLSHCRGEPEFVIRPLLSSALLVSDELHWAKQALPWKWVQHSRNTAINRIKARQQILVKSSRQEHAVTKCMSNPQLQEPSLHRTLSTLLLRRGIRQSPDFLPSLRCWSQSQKLPTFLPFWSFPLHWCCYKKLEGNDSANKPFSHGEEGKARYKEALRTESIASIQSTCISIYCCKQFSCIPHFGWICRIFFG